ncbi:MAG: ABC transporter ATP-binding protein [Cyanothece sp. SIO1E1]|nr:ABC transporter ATP-binding protein [Cyanothece sp. SIO1E1]
MASVVFEYVTKRFDDFVAVNDLNITVADQEFLVFVGPSGCGKTTSLRMLAGLEDVTEGNIYINDRRVNDIPPKDRDIAMVFQSYALYPHMSVYENMAFSLELQGKRTTEIKARVERAAEQMGIRELLYRKPKQLSGGQRQRVAVCRAIVRDPAVFLMDEPLSNLDAKLRVQARAEISKLHKQLGTTFVYVTHDQVEAMTMGTRIAVMNQGVLQQIDTPQNLYNHPKNVFVAGFMGSPAMNFFAAQLTSTEDELYITTDSFRLRVPSEQRQRYEPYQGQAVILGIRPETIHDPNYAPPGIQPALVHAKISVTELMGNEVILYLNTESNQEFVARVDPRSPMTVGQSVSVAFDMDNFHLFDQQTEQIIAGI